RFLNTLYAFGAQCSGTIGELHFLGLFKADAGHLGNALGKGPAANGKHFGAFNPAVIDQGNVSSAAADVHKDGAKFAALLTAHAFSNCERLSSNTYQVQ